MTATCLALAPPPRAQSAAATATDTRADVYYVATTGRDTTVPDCADGTEAAPWRTLTFALKCLTPGDRLYVRGGDYRERVLTLINRGRADAPIRVTAYPGERPVVVGLIRLEGADHWTVDGINVTGDGRPYGSGEYLVKMRGGVGWTFSNAEVWNARSYAALRVEASPIAPLDRWRVVDNCIHDTLPTNGRNEDHNIYVDTGLSAGSGLIARNLVFDAPNGTNLKMGPGANPDSAAVRVAVRYNTFVNGVQNVLASGRSHHLRLERNLFATVIRPAGKSFYPHVRGFSLTGSDNTVRNNVGSDLGRLVHNDRGSSPGWLAQSGNRSGVAPRFGATDSCGAFRPRNPDAYTFGRWAPPLPLPRPVARACPPSELPRNPFRDVPPGAAHELTIRCVAWRSVAAGVTPNLYRPAASVNRAQTATMLARLVEGSGGTLPATAPDAYRDDDGSPHEPAINRLAAVGIVGGDGVGRYLPEAPVSRAQMASLIERTYRFRTGETVASGVDYFADDGATAHHAAINAVAAAGLAGGIAEGRFGPSEPVSRAQTATFVARAYDRILSR